jgi:galactonate dehydratase
LTVLAGVHMAVALPNVVYQETVRAHIDLIYGSIIDEIPVIDQGSIHAPERPGLGAAFLPEYFRMGEHNYRCSVHDI